MGQKNSSQVDEAKCDSSQGSNNVFVILFANLPEML